MRVADRRRLSAEINRQVLNGEDSFLTEVLLKQSQEQPAPSRMTPFPTPFPDTIPTPFPFWNPEGRQVDVVA
jgi:hypothetical protein